MTDLVDQMFPPINRKWAPDYTDFNYWRPPVQEFPLPDLTPPSPALSARSDTSSKSTLARLRNFSLVGSRQPVLSKPPFPPTELVQGVLDNGGYRSSHLRQMSSFERLGSRLVALTQSSSYVDDGNGSGSGSGSGTFPSRSSGSASSTYLDSDDEGDIGEVEELKKRRRPRSTSMSSMPGSLDDMHFELGDEEGEGEGEGEEGKEGGYMYDGENEEEAAEEAFDEDFLATGEMQNVPFL
jgi:phosphatidate phosphatase LPIN